MEIHHWFEQLLQLIGRKVGDKLVECQFDKGTAHIRVVFRLTGLDGSRAAGDLNMLVPLLLFNRAAVQFENNALIFKVNICDASTIASFDGRAISGNNSLHMSIVGGNLTSLRVKR